MRGKPGGGRLASNAGRGGGVNWGGGETLETTGTVGAGVMVFSISSSQVTILSRLLRLVWDLIRNSGFLAGASVSNFCLDLAAALDSLILMLSRAAMRRASNSSSSSSEGSVVAWLVLRLDSLVSKLVSPIFRLSV